MKRIDVASLLASGSDLRGLALRGFDFPRRDMRNCRFRHAHLNRADFVKADLAAPKKGYVVEIENEPGSVQIYPASALRPLL